MVRQKGTETMNRNNPWVQLALSILFMLGLGTVYSWSIFRLEVEQVLGIGSHLSGIPYMISLSFYALFMLLGGILPDRLSPRSKAMAGSLLIAGGWLMASLSQSLLTLTLSYGVLMGSGVGLSYGVPLKLIQGWFPKRRGLFSGIILGGFGLSPLLTAPLARLFLEAQGLQGAFRSLGLLFLLTLPVLAFFMAEREALIKPPLPSRPFPILKDPAFRRLYFLFFLGTLGGLSVIGISGSLGTLAYGIPPGTMALALSLFALAGALGRPFFGYLADRLGHEPGMTLAFALSGAAALSLLLSPPSPQIFIPAFALFWFVLGGWMALAPHATRSLFGGRGYARNYGLLFTAYGLGALAGVQLSGMLLAWGGGAGVFWLLLLASSLGLFLLQGRALAWGFLRMLWQVLG